MKDMRDPEKLGLMLRHLHSIDDRADVSSTYDENRQLLDCVPSTVDVAVHLRYPRLDDLIVTTSYDRRPIERLATPPGPPSAPRGPWNEHMVG
jgi:hypothetical protein